MHQSMKNPLLRHLDKTRILSRRYWYAIALLFGFSVVYGQIPNVSKTECYCLDNATTNSNGQYREVVTFTSAPGQTWRISGPIVDFYHPASLPPPAAPILYLNNTKIPEIAPGVYQIQGIRVSGKLWSFYIENWTTGLRQLVTAVNNCTYPPMAGITLSGDNIVCPSAVELYNLPVASYQSLSWTIGGAVNTVPNPPSNSSGNVTVNWTDVLGFYNIKVTGLVNSFGGQARGCRFESAPKVVQVTDNAYFTSIIGDFGNCIGAQETYRIRAIQSNLQNVVWGVFMDPAATIPAVGVIISGSTNNARTVIWPTTTGVYYIAVRGRARANASSDFCDFEDIRRVDIVNEPSRPMACSAEVQVSLSPNCELNVHTDLFLNGMTFPESSYDIMLRDIEQDTIVTVGRLGYGYANKKLEYKVIHECSGVSCWGYLYIEDKAIPALECPEDIDVECGDLNNIAITGLPIFDPSVIIIPTPGVSNEWTLVNFDKCSDVKLTAVDLVTNKICDGPYSSRIVRMWSAVDNMNNTSTCSQQINVLRTTLDDITFPFNYDSDAGLYPSLEACGTWPKIPEGMPFSGNPSPTFTGYPVGVECLNAHVSFTDRKIPICGTDTISSYKLVRKWKVIDHCVVSGTRIREHNQLIVVMDTTAPTVVCQANNSVIDTLETRPWTCAANWNVRAPLSISDCSATNVSVSFYYSGLNSTLPSDAVFVTKSGMTEVVGSGTNLQIINLPHGKTFIKYIVTDICGNATECTTAVWVKDTERPTPVCNLRTVVSIGSDGMAFASASAFNQGSTDNCELACIKVRRMDDRFQWSSVDCDNRIMFTCSDFGKEVVVELGVWDKGGLYNSCMVNVHIQDKLPPLLTVPGPASANCDEDFSDLSRFGSASVVDNCPIQVEELSPTFNLNNCKQGTIRRNFRAVDSGGNTATGSQIITVTNNRRFNLSGNDIRWPADLPNYQGCGQSIQPQNLPNGSKEPEILRNQECADIIISRDPDLIFETDEACLKILRKWNVVDRCQQVANQPGSGTWSKTQIIMVKNNSAPNITFGCSPSHLVMTDLPDCLTNVKVIAAGSDDCTPENKLIWTYTIDEGANGSIEVSNGRGTSIDRNFPVGTHRIIWTVEDECGNKRSCPNVFTISDTKPPTPLCFADLVTVIMPSTKTVSIWASDYDKGSYDNCTPSSLLVASFSTDINDRERRFTCEMLEGREVLDTLLSVYIFDQAKNYDYCSVIIRVQDNGACVPDFGDPDEEEEEEEAEEDQYASLKGIIATEDEKLVEDVQIQIFSTQPEYPKVQLSLEDGTYAFEALQMHESYNLQPIKNDYPLNGVSTLDLILIQRHILDIAKLDSPYKLIAADVNNSSSITVGDISELRKVILGTQTTFSKNSSWRFVNSTFNFLDPSHPYYFEETKLIEALDSNISNANFTAIKIGDVNGSASGSMKGDNEIESRSRLNLLFPNVSADVFEEVNIDVKINEVQSVLGTQFGISFDTESLQLLDILSTNIPLSKENIGLTYLEEGKILISWNNSSPVDLVGSILKLKFKALVPLHNEKVLTLDHVLLPAEIYSLSNGSIVTSRLIADQVNTNISETTEFEVYQNVPNPFKLGTEIPLNIPSNMEVSLKIYDVNGKIVYHENKFFTKGKNSFWIPEEALKTSGVLYYQVETKDKSIVKKMIHIK